MHGVEPISTYRFRHPSANLPQAAPMANGEAKFAEAFALAYSAKAATIHRGSPKKTQLLAREIPVVGLGIADLVAVAWASAEDPEIPGSLDAIRLAAYQPTVRAFEFKLTHWKRGLMQAHRYSYFADAAILVLPLQQFAVAKTHLATFQMLHIGLWGFDDKTSGIHVAYAPRPSNFCIAKYRRLALERVLKATTVAPVS